MPLLDIKKVWRFVHSFRHTTGIEWTDGRTESLKQYRARRAFACWRAIKRWYFWDIL